MHGSGIILELYLSGSFVGLFTWTDDFIIIIRFNIWSVQSPISLHVRAESS